MIFPPSSCPRLVVKIGSALLVDAEGAVRREWLAGIAADIWSRTQEGQEVAVVSSGAIALGARRLGLTKGGRASLEDAQAAASVGQIALAEVWAELLGAHGLTAALILVTLGDLEDRHRYLNASATLERLLSLGVVPVINENDSVATANLRFGDNDRLAARVAQAARADGVVLLSDVDGLYTADPGSNPKAKRLDTIKRITPAIKAMAGSGSASGMGSGGMASKLEAARIATRGGIGLIIASGLIDHPLRSDGGSYFVPKAKASARKGWLGGRLRIAGSIHVDAGAEKALPRGNSLLAAGAREVVGNFKRGDVIDIVGPLGSSIARGLSEYDAGEARTLLGLRSEEQEKVLGYAPRSALVHRDHMVLL